MASHQAQPALKPAEVIQGLPEPIKKIVQRTYALAGEVGVMMTPDLLCLALIEHAEVKAIIHSISQINDDTYDLWMNSYKHLLEEMRGPNRVSHPNYTNGMLEILNEGPRTSNLTPVTLFKRILGSSQISARAVEFFSRSNITAARIHETPAATAPDTPDQATGGDVLSEFCTDLTEQAKNGKLKPVIGRKKEIKKGLEILNKVFSRAFILVGDAGVGKTAIAYGIARVLVSDDCPEKFKGKRLLSVKMNKLLKNTAMRGQLEAKIEEIIKAVNDAKGSIILFWDEIHRIAGEGVMNIGDMLKPALGDGELQLIGATTLDEYAKFIIKDKALERRFPAVTVDEPSEEDTIQILLGLKHLIEQAQNIQIDDEAITTTVRASRKYITDQFDPAKSIGVIDETGSRINLAGGNRMTKEDNLVTIAEQTGIPAEKIGQSEKQKVLKLADELKALVIGQDEPIELIADAVARKRVGVSESKCTSFIFGGKTGIGKTYLTKCLTRLLFDTEDAMIRLDMSEFMEQFNVSRLIGAPPGYVGYDEGGQLTEKVRRRPYAIVLLDEIEKAHPEVFNILLQVLEDGRLTDGKGRVVNFDHVILIMTSNLIGNGTYNGMMQALKGKFRPEFLNRVDEILLLNQLKKEDVDKIVTNLLNETKGVIKTLKKDHNIILIPTPEAIALIGDRGFDPDWGARPLKRTIVKLVENPIAKKYLKDEIKDGDTVNMNIENGELKFIVQEPAAASAETTA